MVRKIWSVGAAVSAVAALAVVPPSSASGQPTCRGLAATIIGTSGADTLRGTPGADVIVGRGGNDRLLGLAGDDVMCGGPGADALVGGEGNDRLFGQGDELVQRGRQTVVRGDDLQGGPGDDYLDVGIAAFDSNVKVREPNTVSFRHSTSPVSVDLRDHVAVGEGTDVVVPGHYLAVEGSPGDDVLQGSGRAEQLDGGHGDDHVAGGGGSDAVLDYHGRDELDGDGGADLLISTVGEDTLEGGPGRDVLVAASPAPATLLGGGGGDYLWRWVTAGETGTIDGGPGANQLELLPQLWFVESPAGTLDAQAGTAVITTSDKSQTTAFSNIDAFTIEEIPWTFLGTEGDDFVQVLSARLDAQGLGGDDFFIGGEYADTLDGGDGSDEAWGGEGHNTCVDTEAGDCDGYPWDVEAVGSSGRRAVRAVAPAATPHRLVTRWLNGRLPGAR